MGNYLGQVGLRAGQLIQEDMAHCGWHHSPGYECGGLKLNGSCRPLESGTIRRFALVGVGVALLEKMVAGGSWGYCRL